MENTHVSIGQRIYDLRIEHDVQQGELSKAIGLHQSVLNRIEKGSRPARDVEIFLIARYFDVSADYLLGIVSQKEQKNNGLPKQTKENISIHDSNIAALSSNLNLNTVETDLISKFRQLDDRGKNSVLDTVAREYEYIFPTEVLALS